VDEGRAVETKSLTKDSYLKALEIMKLYNIDFAVYDSQGIYTPSKKIFDLLGSIGESTVDMLSIDGKYKDIENPVKLLALWDENVEKIMKSLRPHNIAAIRTSNFFLEYIKDGISKGEALDSLTRAYGINHSEVVAIGDSDNDMSMLKLAGRGIVMGNCCENLKREKFIMVSSNDEGGIVEAIERYVL